MTHVAEQTGPNERRPGNGSTDRRDHRAGQISVVTGFADIPALTLGGASSELAVRGFIAVLPGGAWRALLSYVLLVALLSGLIRAFGTRMPTVA